MQLQVTLAESGATIRMLTPDGHTVGADGVWNGVGALVLPEHSYSFGYELKEDKLEIDFEKSSLRDSTFKVSIVDGVMNL